MAMISLSASIAASESMPGSDTLRVLGRAFAGFPVTMPPTAAKASRARCLICWQRFAGLALSFPAISAALRLGTGRARTARHKPSQHDAGLNSPLPILLESRRVALDDQAGITNAVPPLEQPGLLETSHETFETVHSSKPHGDRGDRSIL